MDGVANPFADLIPATPADSSSARSPAVLANPFADLIPTPAAAAAPAQSGLLDIPKAAGAGIDSGLGGLVRATGAAIHSVAGAGAAVSNNLFGTRYQPLDNVLAKPADWLDEKAQTLTQDESPQFQQENAAFKITDPSTYTPRAVAGQVAGLAGQVLPYAAGAALVPEAEGPALFSRAGTLASKALPLASKVAKAAIGGGAFFGGSADTTELENVRNMPLPQLQALPGYQQRLAQGMAPDQARESLAQEAGQQAFNRAAPVGTALSLVPGAAFGERLVSPEIVAARTVLAAAKTPEAQAAAESALKAAVAKTSLAKSLAVNVPISAAEGGVQMAASQAAQNVGYNAATGDTRPIGQGTGEAAATGVLLGAGMRGAEIAGDAVLHPRAAAVDASGQPVTTPADSQAAAAPDQRAPIDQQRQAGLDQLRANIDAARTVEDRRAAEKAYTDAQFEPAPAVGAFTSPAPTADAGAAPQPQTRPVWTEDQVRAHAQSTLDALTAKAKGTPDQPGTDNEANPITIPGELPQVLDHREQGAYRFLQANVDNPSALADRIRVDIAPPPDSIAAAVDPLVATHAAADDANRAVAAQPGFSPDLFQHPSPNGAFPDAEPGSLSAAANVLPNERPTTIEPASTPTAIQEQSDGQARSDNAAAGGLDGSGAGSESLVAARDASGAATQPEAVAPGAADYARQSEIANAAQKAAYDQQYGQTLQQAMDAADNALSDASLSADQRAALTQQRDGVRQALADHVGSTTAPDAGTPTAETGGPVASTATAASAAPAAPASAMPDVQAAADTAATSPANDTPTPSPAQLEAGNYQMGHVKIGGLDVSIEHPAGVARKEGFEPLAHHYGYIRGTIGTDKEHIDAFLGPKAADTTLPVYVVDQQSKSGKFDEHKVMLGFGSHDEARAAYLANYPEGWQADHVTQMSHAQFRAWSTDPVASKKPAAAAATRSEIAPTSPPSSAIVAGKPGVDASIATAVDTRPGGALDTERKTLGIPRVMTKADAVNLLRTHGGLTAMDAKRAFSATDRKGLREGTRLGTDMLALARSKKAESDAARTSSSPAAPAATTVEKTDGLHLQATRSADGQPVPGASPARAESTAEGGAVPARSGELPAGTLAQASDQKTVRAGQVDQKAAAAQPVAAAPAHIGPKMWVRGRGVGNAQVVLAADGKWYVRNKEVGQWQAWRKVKSFDPSRVHGYHTFTPDSGRVRIPGVGHVEIGARKEAPPKFEKPPQDLLQHITASGGLNREAFKKEGVDPAEFKARTFGVGKWLFPKEGGMTPSGLREWMQERDHGYLPEDHPDSPANVEDNDAIDLVHRALGGDEIYRPGLSDEVARYQDQANHESEQARLEQEAAAFHDHAAEEFGFDIPAGDEALAMETYYRAADVAGMSDEEWKSHVQSLLDEEQARAHQNAATQDSQRSAPARESGQADAAAPLELTAPGNAEGTATQAAKETQVARPAGDLFGGATNRERADAASRDRTDQLNGKNGTITPSERGLPLFAGIAPEQTHIEDAAKPTGVDQAAAPITDVGEKIGGARKDLSGGRTEQPKAADPPRYEAAQTRDGTRWLVQDAKTQQRVMGVGGFAAKLFDTHAAAQKEAEGLNAAREKAKASESSWRKRYAIVDNATGEVGRSPFAIRDMRTGRLLAGSDAATEAEAEAKLPSLLVAKNHRVTSDGDKFKIVRDVTDRKRVTVVDQRFETRHEAMKYMADHAADIIDTKKGYGEEILARPETVNRQGASRRTGDVNGQHFKDTFGFRGVEFGNWNNQAERQEVMNHAYDGLHDLAELLNIPPQAISLNGEIGLAFGARGTGGKVAARAHYEPDYGVMNLTKMKGAGTLAHEWFHALDHYLGRLSGKAQGERITNERGDKVFNAKGSTADFQSYGDPRASKMRPELAQAYHALMDTMLNKAEQYVEDTAQAQKFVGRSHEYLASKLQEIRDNLSRQQEYGSKRAPATPEQLAQFDTHSAKLLEGPQDFAYRSTANEGTPMRARGGMAGRQTNDTLEAMSAINKAVRGRSGFSAEGGGIFDTVRVLAKNHAERLRMLESAAKQESKTKQMPTSYRMEAKKIDQGTVKDYWATPHELAARAFSGYVEDKLEAAGNRSDFMSFGSDNNLPDYRMYGVKPFPEGQEREAMDAAFDKFFQTVRTEETPQGTTRLFSKEASNLRTHGLPEAVGEPVSLFRNTDQLKENPNYAPAKAGDVQAAAALVRDLAKPLVEKARARFGEGAIYVAPHAEEASGRNKIPQMLADALSNGTHGTVDTDIVQNSRAFHTGANYMERLASRPTFAGDVVKGGRYVLVDDVTQTGGTLAELANHIQQNGGTVEGVVTLTNAAKDGRLAADAKVTSKLEGRFGDEIRQQLHVDPSALTHAEAGYLTGFRTADELRNRITKARQETGQRLRAKGLFRLGTAQEKLNDAPPSAGRSTSGITLDRAQQLKNELTAKWGENAPRVRLVENAEGFPAGAKVDPGYVRAKGLYDGKPVVYLNLDKIRDEHDFRTVLAHEALGHYGVEHVVGAKEWGGIVDAITRIDQSGAGDKTVRSAIAEARKREGPQVDRVTLAKEAIAIMAERGDRNGLIDRVVAAVRRVLRTMMPSMKWNEADIRGLISRADSFLHAGQTRAERVQAMQAHSFSKYAQTDTPEFKRFFGDSKVVDAHGDPMPVYHGTASDFWSFDNNKLSSNTGHMTSPLGFFFDERADKAQHYAEKSSAGVPADERVIDAYVSMKNPAELTKDQFMAVDDYDQAKALRTKLMEQGHDGIHIPEMHQWVAFKPEQIKSASENRGSFDPNNPHILFSRTNQTKEAYDDQKASPAFSERSGLQLPRDVRQLRGYGQRVLTEADLVKYRADHEASSQAQPLFSKAASDNGAREQPTTDTRSNRIKAQDELKQSGMDVTHIQNAIALMHEGSRLGQLILQKVGRGIMGSMLSRVERANGQAAVAFKNFQTYFDKMRPQSKLSLINDWETGKEIQDAQAAPFMAAMKKEFDRLAAEIQRKTGRLQELAANYFPHLWKDPAKAQAMYDTWAGKKKLGGATGFLQERDFPTLKEGMDQGLEPVSDNPADVALMHIQAMQKMLALHDMLQELHARGMTKFVQPGERVPAGFTHVDDRAFDVYRPVGEKDFAKAGQYAVPELVAKDINNYLSPGLGQLKGWHGFRWAQNMLLSARLGLSAFHAGMTTLDSFVSHMDVGARRLLTGDIAGGLRELVNGVTSPITGPLNGLKLLKQYYGEMASDPQTAAVLDALTEGGARGRMDATEYNSDATKMLRAVRQGEYKQAAKSAIPGAIEATTRLIAHHLVPAQKMAARVMLAKFALDKIAKQLQIAPGDYAATTAAMHPDALRQIMGKINADVDDRLGQFTYDNLHWNRVVRDALHASVQSVGWNAGTLRLLFGGAADVRRLAKPEPMVSALNRQGGINAKYSRLTGRLSYLIALNATVALAGASLQKLLTDEWPTEGKDFFFPKTGRTNASGSAERVSFPSYVKDEWALATHPLQTLEHKLHPSFSMMAEILQNKDYYGSQVFDPEANIPTQGKQLLSYMAQGFTPYAVLGAQRNTMAEQNDGQDHSTKNALLKAAPFVGVTPAPSDITLTKFEDYVQQKYVDTLPQGARDADSVAKSQARKDAMHAMRAGLEPDLSQFAPRQIREMRKESQQDVFATRFAKLTLVQKLRAYDLASPTERERYNLADTIDRHLNKNIRALPADQQDGVRAHADAILNAPPAAP